MYGRGEITKAQLTAYLATRQKAREQKQTKPPAPWVTAFVILALVLACVSLVLLML